MDQDERTVAGALDVDLDQVAAGVDRDLDGGEGVLGGVGAGTAVGDGEDHDAHAAERTWPPGDDRVATGVNVGLTHQIASAHSGWSMNGFRLPCQAV